MWKQNALNHTSHFTSYDSKLNIKKKFNVSLPYGEFKFETWVSKILLSLNKGLNKKKP